MKRALIVVAKEPSAGRTKTRLSPPLTAGQAVEVYEALLLDTLALMSHVQGVERLVNYLPLEAEGYFRRILPDGFLLLPQEGADLGARLDHILSYCLGNGFRQAVVMDSDSPTLPATLLHQAYDALGDPETDVVLGPCDDGGYYLVGCKRRCSALFQGITMSTPTVLAETLERAARHGLRVALLPGWYDVDTVHDLRRLRTELESLPDGWAEHTRSLLRTLSLGKGVELGVDERSVIA